MMGWRGLFARLQVLVMFAGVFCLLVKLTTLDFAIVVSLVATSFVLVITIIWLYLDIMFRWWDQ